MDTKIKTSKEKWIELCRKYNKWCNWNEVREFSPKLAEFYIKTMPCWDAMEKI